MYLRSAARPFPFRRRLSGSPSGLTLVELLVAGTILALIAGGLATLASTVQITNQHQQARGLALQHGRVTLERIQRALNEATASAQFPGFVSFAESEGGNDYPDTLVVWHPSSSASDPDGLPLVSELVVFCPDPSRPNRLLEIRVPDDGRTVPSLADTATWKAELAAIKADPSARNVVLTDLVRVVAAGDASANMNSERAAVRFLVTLRPSDAEWAEYLAGSRTWENISWVQDVYGSDGGLRQAWCRFEIQLRPADVEDNSAAAAMPLLGSGAVFFRLEK